MLTRNGGEFFWCVELHGARVYKLDRGDGVSKLFGLLEIEIAKEAAIKFAHKVLGTGRPRRK
jgi:hypothetical protein